MELILDWFHNLFSWFMETFNCFFSSILIKLNNHNIFSLNSFWSSLGITDLRFLTFLNIIFLLLFFSLNIYLLYIEFFKKEEYKTRNNSYMESGMNPELKRIASYFTAAVSVYASYITIRTDMDKSETEATLRAELEKTLAKAREDSQRAQYTEIKNNFSNKLNMFSIQESFTRIGTIRKEKSDLFKAIEDLHVDWNQTNDSSVLEKLEKKRKYESRIQSLNLEEDRAHSVLSKDITNGSKFLAEISKETDESKALKLINGDDDVKKSSIFDLDLEKLWNKFESLSGITKLALSMIISFSLVLWCVFGLILNLYSNYLLDRFNLDQTYPKIAYFIRLRRKLGKYYLISNIIIIILTSLTNIYFGIAILSLFL